MQLIRLLRAYLFAVWQHRGQVDKGGQPYRRHLVRVAWLAYGLTGKVEAAVVGLLHDYVEDVNPATGLDELERRFGPILRRRVALLSRHVDDRGPRELRYEAYISQLIWDLDPLTLSVKLADLLHNTDPSRGGQVTEAKRRSYEEALKRVAVARMLSLG